MERARGTGEGGCMCTLSLIKTKKTGAGTIIYEVKKVRRASKGLAAFWTDLGPV